MYIHVHVLEKNNNKFNVQGHAARAAGRQVCAYDNVEHFSSATISTKYHLGCAC